MRHPFDTLDQRHVVAATAGLALSFVILTAVLLHAVPVEDLSRIRDLAQASSNSVARSLLAEWPSSTLEAFSFLLGFDLLYDLVHNNAVALFAIWGARRLSSGKARFAASVTAWIMWLDTGLNVFENLAFLHIVRTFEPAPLLPFAAAVFSFRTATWIAGLLVGISLHLMASRSRSTSAA